MAEQIIYCIVISAIQIVALSILVFTALSSELRFSKTINGLLMLLLEAVAVSVYLMVFSDVPIFKELSFLISVVFNVFTIFFFLIYFRGNFYQNLFVIFIVKNYLDIVSMCVADLKKICIVFFANPLWGDVVILVGMTVISLPFAYLFMAKLLRRVIVETKAMSFWRFIWTIPLCFFLLFRFSVYPQIEQQSFINIIFVPIIWTVGTFYVYYIILRVFSEMSKNIALEEQVRLMDLQIEMRQLQYKKLQEHWEEIRRIRHDMRHHFRVVQDLAGDKRFGEIETYMAGLMEDIAFKPNVYLCENTAVNALAGYYKKKAEDAGIAVDFKFDVPEDCFVSVGDLSVIFGNLLENALEACERQDGGETFIKASAISSYGSRMVISVKNSFAGGLMPLQDTFVSSKRQDGEAGVGIVSVRAIAQKYMGTVKIDATGGCFSVYVMLHKKS
ncbi:MAG: GHKL domain-containing protein [Eubacterium sp.]|nr:GHKL domain-containing protein [Eubacterium sp.]